MRSAVKARCKLNHHLTATGREGSPTRYLESVRLLYTLAVAWDTKARLLFSPSLQGVSPPPLLEAGSGPSLVIGYLSTLGRASALARSSHQAVFLRELGCEGPQPPGHEAQERGRALKRVREAGTDNALELRAVQVVSCEVWAVRGWAFPLPLDPGRHHVHGHHLNHGWIPNPLDRCPPRPCPCGAMKPIASRPYSPSPTRVD